METKKEPKKPEERRTNSPVRYFATGTFDKLSGDVGTEPFEYRAREYFGPVAVTEPEPTGFKLREITKEEFEKLVELDRSQPDWLGAISPEAAKEELERRKRQADS